MEIVRKSQTINILEELLSGKITRDAASDWADDLIRRDFDGEDSATVEAVHSLWAADLITIDRPYLFVEEDFAAWLEELRSSIATPEASEQIRE